MSQSRLAFEPQAVQANHGLRQQNPRALPQTAWLLRL